jgi:glyoxylate/hydroxypyruvate reductase A
MNIFVDTPLKEHHKRMLIDGAPSHRFIFKDEIEQEQEQLQKLLEADILFGNIRPAEWLQQAQQLKWIQFYSAGFELYKKTRTAATVTNMRDYYSEPCAETMVAGILGLYRGIDQFTELKEKKQWLGAKARPGLGLLRKKKVLILGAGNIGKRVEKLLSGFDCDILYFSRKEKIKTISELEQRLPEMDIVVACLPGTDETTGLFTSAMLRKLKSDAIFCNVGRGNLLEDESVLVELLMQKKIRGAVLDVTAEEPLPAGHAFWDCPNTILTQHSGGGSNDEFEGIIGFFLENLSNFEKGLPLKNPVELNRGY